MAVETHIEGQKGGAKAVNAEKKVVFLTKNKGVGKSGLNNSEVAYYLIVIG